MDCSLPGSSIHGILQARILEWVAISFSRGSSQPRDWTWISRNTGRHFTIWTTREAHFLSFTWCDYNIYLLLRGKVNHQSNNTWSYQFMYFLNWHRWERMSIALWFSRFLRNMCWLVCITGRVWWHVFPFNWELLSNGLVCAPVLVCSSLGVWSL